MRLLSFLSGVPLDIPQGLYSGTSLGGTTRGILGGFPGRVLSSHVVLRHPILDALKYVQIPAISEFDEIRHGG